MSNAFALTPESIDAICAERVKTLEAVVTAVGAVTTGKASFASTVLKLETAITEFGNALNVPIFLKYVSTDDKVRDAADRAERAIQRIVVDLFAREDLYRAVRAAADARELLRDVEKRLLEEYITLFRRNGLELSAENRALLVEKRKRLVELEAEFGRRLVEWDDSLVVTEKELDGVPPAFIETLEKRPGNKRVVRLSYPHFNAVTENAKSDSLRQELEKKFFNRGGDKNREMLEEALRLRDETARLLGYPSHAHYVLERRMAKTPEQVTKFLLRLREELRAVGKRDVDYLLEFKRELTGDKKAKPLASHEWRYLENTVKRTRFQLDTQVVKEYFPLDVVISGMFEIYQRLLGVTFTKRPAEAWHDSVERYDVVSGGNVVATFFTDLFPRDGKYNHAAAFTLRSGYRRQDGSYERPASAIVANFTPPTKDKPSLLDHGEVETLFHEFGHIMHQVLTRAEHGTFSGTNVKTDFVEAPSQMLENWVWQKSTLSKLSGHYLDRSKRLPDEMIDALLQLKRLDIGIRYLRQISFALIDLSYHSGTVPDDTTEAYRKITEETMPFPLAKGTMPQASFGHLMGGYDAGYYGYLWSEVYAQDMFTRFEKSGLLDEKTGAEYRRWILEPGGEREPADLIRGFLGREPDERAFLDSLGLPPKAKPS